MVSSLRGLHWHSWQDIIAECKCKQAQPCCATKFSVTGIHGFENSKVLQSVHGAIMQTNSYGCKLVEQAALPLGTLAVKALMCRFEPEGTRLVCTRSCGPTRKRKGKTEPL